MEIVKDYDLSELNTFGIKARTDFFVEIKNELDFKELLKRPEYQTNKKLFLGGGSNVLFTKDFDGIVILNKLKGIEILEENSKNVLVKAQSGEKWHDLVLFAVEHDYWGIENLSLVPGTVGASPVQNIGAYGVELKDSIESVEFFDLENGEKKILSCAECKFDYRYSIFKNELKGKVFITAAIFKLSKVPNLNITYKVLKEYLTTNNIQVQKVKDVSDAVIAIRESKLPSPKILGNAGSFFKNVYVSKEDLEGIKEKYPDISFFEEAGVIKIPAGWLIEKCGWKGKRLGRVGVHDKQALVLVNFGGATGGEVKDLADQIIDSVFVKFGLKLTPEVNLI